MGDCITTRLVGALTADLPKKGEMVINVVSASQITGVAISGGNENDITVTSSKAISVSGFDNPGTSFTFKNYRSLTLPDGKYTLKISPKYGIAQLYLRGGNALTMVSKSDLAWVTGTLSVNAVPSVTGNSFAFMKGALATNISCLQNGIKDTLENFAAYHHDISTLTTLTAYNNTITGSLDDFISQATALKSIWITGGVTGQLSNVRKNFTVLKLIESQVTGSLEDIGDITTLTGLSLFGSRLITGSLEDLEDLTNLTEISLGYNSNISGSLSDLATLTNLASLSLTTMANVSGTLSSLSTMTALTTLSISNLSVTGAVEDLLDGMVTNGRTSGTLTISSLPSGCTYNGAAFSGSKKFDFSGSGWAEHTN